MGLTMAAPMALPHWNKCRGPLRFGHLSPGQIRAQFWRLRPVKKLNSLPCYLSKIAPEKTRKSARCVVSAALLCSYRPRLRPGRVVAAGSCATGRAIFALLKRHVCRWPLLFRRRTWKLRVGSFPTSCHSLTKTTSRPNSSAIIGQSPNIAAPVVGTIAVFAN
jgi:hypothetical protein